MHILPNNCRCSNLTVTPSDWNTKKATTERDWIISYRFYCEEYPKGKLIQFRTNNRIKDLKERQLYTEGLLKSTLNDLYDGYNPIKKGLIVTKDSTCLSGALRFALDKLKVIPETKKDVNIVVERFLKSANELDLDIDIKAITRRNIREILDHIADTSNKFTDNTFNHFRKYLNILFSELVEFEIIGANPVKDIKKRKIARKIKPVLTSEQRKAIDEHLKKYPSFRRFLHIFYHSGARVRELMRMKCKDVNLKKQEFTVIIRKGKMSREEKKPIKDVALPFWKEIDLSNPDNFVFSEGLNAGEKPIRPDQINKRWTRLVVEPLKISATFYSLKHLHSDELAKELGLQASKAINSHESENITKLYAQGEKERQMDRIKKVGNGFA